MEQNKFEYFMKRTEQDLSHIRAKVDKLWDFRLLLIGASMTVSVVCSAVVSIASIYFKAK